MDTSRVAPRISAPRTGRITAAGARRIALAAQGFDRRRPATAPSTRRILDLVRRLGVLQLDSVNVFSRAHYMPVFSRLGPYDRARLDRIAGHGTGRVDRRLVEYWAHEASLIPIELHPLFRWRMADVQSEAWGSIARVARERPELVAETLELVAEQGPIRARDTGAVRPPPRAGHMWNWHEGKVALEYLFFTGQVAAARRVNFERLYDTVDRVVPAEIRERRTPTAADAQRQLVRIAAQALGVATEPDLGDYFRLPRAASKDRVAELVASDELIPVEVEGWGAPAYLSPAARRPRRLHARALLSPFDSLIWFRQRTERLFGFRYRIEIYTPAAKRVHGYYVLPFLLGDRLVGRVDLKSDRSTGTLRVQGAFGEDGIDRAVVAAELVAELRLVAGWLGLAEIAVAARGDLSQELADQLPALCA
ncbi:MAG TPA: crosslink repair DNA glycosylase YcaQ family protein [Solirubrobacteraceae bacterium]|nr:crosslink repair DNA glycosylase YcaQ family protein [Solirubrobacteraceae bacterium]